MRISAALIVESFRGIWIEPSLLTEILDGTVIISLGPIRRSSVSVHLSQIYTCFLAGLDDRGACDTPKIRIGTLTLLPIFVLRLARACRRRPQRSYGHNPSQNPFRQQHG